jgi:hypothetical protein
MSSIQIKQASPFSRSFLAVCACAALAACNPNAPCNWENRGVATNGYLGPVTARDFGASVAVTQVKDHSDEDELGWSFFSNTYAGHITGVQMYDAANPSRVLATFPITAPKAVEFSAKADPAVNAVKTVSYSELYEILRANGARVRATTDLTPAPPLDVLLSVSSQHDWAKMGCAG